MDAVFFIKGLIFGFSIALPVGPIGILCIRRSLAGGWSAGLLTGLLVGLVDYSNVDHLPVQHHVEYQGHDMD